ncbi:hypothetical protein H4R20_001851 [Coemansia guatemalensis]|uniref:Arrestin C-terminal-like domain-containing protein n=1 Tax=Coemansia guatemalensis TaxID=2761395 RepID=A0A9W8HWN9_9FUNG|nr:hypothetical protein H4R20_001851 [Coemansia guatemalensis]
MRTSPHLEIVLDKPDLLVRGSFDEATPALLSGRLIVHLSEPIRVRSLRMVFNGRIDTFLNQTLVSNSVAKDEHREFGNHEWEFLKPQKPSVIWGPESKVFPFDLWVPGDNPETIVTALGKVRYMLQATLERTSFHVNLTAAVEVPVKRGPMPGAPWALALMESIEAVGQWEEQLDYRVSVPTRSLKDGELFHTQFELQPRTKGLKLIAAGVLIKEYVRYYSSSGESLHKFARVVARNENYISPAGVCTVQPRRADNCMNLVDATSVQIPLAIPEAYGNIQYDVITDLIEVRHRIKFLIKVRDTNMLIHSIFIAVPVTIMPVNARDDSCILPRYESAILNPGAVIMRSDTLPPSYDALLRPSASTANTQEREQQEDDDEENDTPLVLEPGEDIDGFPGPLERSRSQFYLASPDQSPPLRPRSSIAAEASSSSTVHDTNTTSSEHRRRESRSSSQTASTLGDNVMGEPSDANALPPTAATAAAVGIHNETAEKCMRGSERCNNNASPTPSKSGSMLHERLAGTRISDKVRSIFHGRSSSSASSCRCSSGRHSRRASNASSCGGCPSATEQPQPNADLRSMTPPPARIREPLTGAYHTVPRGASAAPPMLPPRNSLAGGTPAARHSIFHLGAIDAEDSDDDVPLRPPPEAFLQPVSSPHLQPVSSPHLQPIASPHGIGASAAPTSPVMFH